MLAAWVRQDYLTPKPQFFRKAEKDLERYFEDFQIFHSYNSRSTYQAVQLSYVNGCIEIENITTKG